MHEVCYVEREKERGVVRGGKGEEVKRERKREGGWGVGEGGRICGCGY